MTRFEKMSQVTKIISIIFYLIFFLFFIIMNLVVSITTPDYSKLFYMGCFVVLGVIRGVTEFVEGLHFSTKYGLTEGAWALAAHVFFGLVFSMFV